MYQWFFDCQAQEIKIEIEEKLTQIADNERLQRHFDKDQYIGDTLLDMKSFYLSEVDVLTAILYEQKNVAFSQIDCVKTDFSNIEFYCVLTLYYASVAIKKLSDSKKLEDITDILIEVSDAILEAHIAIGYANQLSTINWLEHEGIAQDFIKSRWQELAKKSHDSRYGGAYQKRKEKACELDEKGSYKSRLNAALHLIDPVQKYSEEFSIPTLKPDSAQDTIYKWLSQYDKDKARIRPEPSR